VPARVVPTGGALFYSAHAQLGPRSLARFVRTFPAAVRTAQRVLREQRPDVLHLNTSVLLAWAAAARRQRVPVVWMVREVLGPNPYVRAWHAGFISSRARRVVAISQAVRACFPAALAERVSVVYNAVDLAEFDLDLLHAAQDVRRELGLDPRARVVIAIGSVQRPKGHWLLLDALARLQDAQLVLVAGGVPATYAHTWRGRTKRALGRPLDNLDALLRDARRRGLIERICVTGFRRDVARLLAAADVLVFPSLQPEGFGRPIIEAMAMARPVVATRVGPSAELLGPEAGRLVPPDAQALAAALDELLRSAATRARLGAAGRRRVEACFSLERQVAAMQAIYREATPGA
jgi:glycosyltransferase involved in cell wall biosynthesis